MLWISWLCTLSLLVAVTPGVQSFSFVLMVRRGKGDLQRSLNDNNASASSGKNKNRGQEVTGVTLPAPNSLRGWEFGEGVSLVVAATTDARTDQPKYWALQAACPRCAFDLFKGDLIVDDAGFRDLPIVACPTCSTTYSLRTGKHGPPLKRTGLQAFTSNLAKTATATDAYKDAKAFTITRDEDGTVYCQER